MTDVVIIVDWSARSAPSPERPSADAIWIAEAQGSECRTHYVRTRADAYDRIVASISDHLEAGRRVLVGVDVAFGYPDGFATALTGSADPFAVWDWLSCAIEDDSENRNNRFEVAQTINRKFNGIGPFWGRPVNLDLPDLPDKGSLRTGHGLPERRAVENDIRSAQAVWKLYTTGSVGSQVLVGLPWLNRLRRTFSGQVSVWPFEDPDAPLVLAEIYPSLLNAEVAAEMALAKDAIKDEVQVRLLARALMKMAREDKLGVVLDAPEIARREGWILGASAVPELRRFARPDLSPPSFDNDCFALPPGVDWVPVDEALHRLGESLSAVTGTEWVNVFDADNRIVADPVVARRANPPAANSAVDGYGFQHAAVQDGPNILPLHPGRAAAGAPFDGALPEGTSLRILTGAALPDGVDTVVLEEDTLVDRGHVAFSGPVKAGANTRRAGEDIDVGDSLFAAGHRLTSPDLALLSVAGVADVEVRKKLRVGVLSTGDELMAPGSDPGSTGIFDANRPMLLSLVTRWGHAPVDLGIAPDSMAAVRDLLNGASDACDAILTSGGASAGDEDHISALLNAEGHVAAWRIAMKPGRPLLFGAWQGVPFFGLPGNPVAAFVCALVFAHPALARLSGRPWRVPDGVTVPAGFSKSKKNGRREYLRARLNDRGHAEVFKSEGSGRVSGLSWATGLVELPDEAIEVTPGDPVRFLPFAEFGI